MGNAIKVILFIIAAYFILPPVFSWLYGFMPSSTEPIQVTASLTKEVSVDGSYVTNAQGKHLTLVNSATAHNPTWEELTGFLMVDQTDKIPYDLNSFSCGDFAVRLHNNAEAAQIRTALVVLKVISTDRAIVKENIRYHSLNAFEVVGRGLVYIDDTSSGEGGYADKIVNIEAYKPYEQSGLFADMGQTIDWRNNWVVMDIMLVQW